MAGTNTTQFIFIKHGNNTDEAIDYFNSGDTSVTNFATGGPTGTNTGIVSPIAIQADLTGGFYYIIDPQFSGDGSADGQIHLGKIATPTTAPTTVYTVPDNSGAGNEFSEANAITIDTTNHVLYLAQVVYNNSLDGLDSRTGIVSFNYDATTGALGTATPIVTRGAAGTQATDANIDEVAQLSLDSTHHVLYFTDDTFGKGTFVGANETNSVKAYNTVTHLETTVVTFPSGSDTNVEFPTGYTNGTIFGVAADPTDNLVFFSTASGFSGSESLNSIYVITPSGTGEVKLTEAATYDSLAPFNLTFDDVHNKLYVSYSSTDPSKPGHLVEYDVNIPTPGSTVGITLSNPVDIGLSLNDPSPSNVDYPLSGILDQLPVLTTTGTTAHATEQGSAVTLLAAGTTITDADQTQLVSATVKITGGTFSSNENSTADDHLGFAAANVTGSLINGTNIHFAYTASTETLTLTGTDSLADYNLALSEVQYFTTGDNPTNYGSNATRTVTWQVNDGAIGNPSGTNTTTTTLNIDAVNDAPVATTPGAHYAATEQTNLSLKNTGLSVSDVDGGIVGQPESVTLSVGEGILTLAVGTSGAVLDSGNGTGSVTFHGTIAQINALLNTNATSSVTYNDNTDTPSASTTLTLQVNDNGNTGSGGSLTGSNTATIDITAVNDAPVAVITTNPYAATENVALDLKNTGMSVSDVDAQGGSETVTLSTNEGTLTLDVGTSGAIIDSGNDTNSVTFHGTIAQLNALLNTDGTSSVSYIDNNDNPAATDPLVLSIDDNGHTGTGGPLTAFSVTSTVDITAINDAPAATTPAADYTATEQTDLSLKNTGLAVSDVDGSSGSETVTLSVGEGILTLAAGTSGAVIDSGNGSGSVTFHGTISQINALLNANATSSVIYNDNTDTPSANTTLTLAINDNGNTGTGGPLTDSNTATIDITALNDAPAAAMTTNPYAATENVALDLKNTGMSVSDVDAQGGSETVTLSANEGTLTLDVGTSGAVIDSGNGTGSVTFHGTIDQLNALLNTDGTSAVSYVDNNDNPAATDLLTLSIDDGGNTGAGGPLTASATSIVDITAVNDAPVATTPGAPYPATEQVNLSLKNTGLSVSDPDGNSGSETVTLSVGEGTLTLAAGTSGAVIDSGNGTGSVTFHGTIAQINDLLNTDATSTFIYNDNTDTPSANTTLTLQINDNGNTGTGGPLTGSNTATIDIAAVNDAPAATTPADYTATENVALDLKNTGMSVNDIDAQGASETVTLSAGEGILTLAVGTSGAVIDSGNGTGSVTFHGTIAQINALLNTDGTSAVSYVDNNDNPAATALLTLSINDGGHTGAGGPLTASATSTVDITAVNDAPVALIATNPYDVAPNTALDLKNTGISVSDVDGNNGVETVILSVTEGTLTLGVGTSGAVIDSGNGTGSVTFEGTIAQINALMNTDGTSAVSYIDSSPTPASSATLSMSINDDGHTGTGGPLTDTATSAIAILNGSRAPGAFDFNFNNDGDGHADILLQNNSSAVSIWDNASPSHSATIADSVPGWHLAGIGDFDGNGRTDILWTTDSGRVAIWDNSVTGHTIATGVPSSWHLVGTGDFDGNGKSDILWQNDSGAVAIWDNGQIGHTVAGPGSMLPTNEHVVATGDFDGNGKTDILWQNTANGALTVWNNGQPAGASTIATSMPSTWHVAGVGDFDGNGKSDILWQNDNGSVAIWDNGQTGHTIATGMPSSWHVAGVSDFDHNGKSDILWANDNGAVAIWDNGQTGHTIAAPGTVPPDWHIIA
jgi:hypothetical protein